MNIRLFAPLVAVAAVLGVAAPAQAGNVQLLGLTIKWAAVMEKDAATAARALGAVKPSSSVGVQVRDQLSLALRTYQASGRELHFAVVAAQRNDSKGATSHVTKAVTLAKTGAAQMTRASLLLKKLKI